MRIHVDVRAFHDHYPLSEGEGAPDSAIVTALADGRPAVRFLRREHSTTSIDIPTLDEDWDQYLEAIDAARNEGKTPVQEWETKSEFLEGHLRHVMAHHAPREHWLGLGVEPGAEAPDEVSAHEKHLQQRFGIGERKPPRKLPNILNRDELREAMAHEILKAAKPHAEEAP